MKENSVNMSWAVIVNMGWWSSITYFYGNTSFNGQSHTECQSRIKNSVGSSAVGLPSSITMVEGDCMVFLLYHPQIHPVFYPTSIIHLWFMVDISSGNHSNGNFPMEQDDVPIEPPFLGDIPLQFLKVDRMFHSFMLTWKLYTCFPCRYYLIFLKIDHIFPCFPLIHVNICQP